MSYFASCHNIDNNTLFFSPRDAHNIVKEKQRMIDSSHEALQYLKPVSIAWPITASEVLVTGSFDGWSSQV